MFNFFIKYIAPIPFTHYSLTLASTFCLSSTLECASSLNNLLTLYLYILEYYTELHHCHPHNKRSMIFRTDPQASWVLLVLSSNRELSKFLIFGVYDQYQSHPYITAPISPPQLDLNTEVK